jgi:hypothetical protein
MAQPSIARHSTAWVGTTPALTYNVRFSPRYPRHAVRGGVMMHGMARHGTAWHCVVVVGSNVDCPLTQRRVCNAQPCATWHGSGLHKKYDGVVGHSSGGSGGSNSNDQIKITSLKQLNPMALLASDHGLASSTGQDDDDAAPMARRVQYLLLPMSDALQFHAYTRLLFWFRYSSLPRSHAPGVCMPHACMACRVQCPLSTGQCPIHNTGLVIARWGCGKSGVLVRSSAAAECRSGGDTSLTRWQSLTLDWEWQHPDHAQL